MHLVVIRHGIAEAAAAGQDDASRELTSEGERKLKRVVLGLRALGWQFDRVLTSPKARALRTAELLAPISDSAPITTELFADSPTPDLLAMIAKHGVNKDQVTAVVGHEPWLGELAGLLAFGDAKQGEPLLIKKAGVVWLEGTSTVGGMRLRAMLPPSVLVKLR